MTIIPKNDRLRRDIATCLQATDSLIPYLIPPPANYAPSEPLNEDVKRSAEASFHNATTKLDELISGLGKYETEERFEQKILMSAEADIRAKLEAAITAANCRRPSVVYQPTITKSPAGCWCAIYGNPDMPENCVVGVGASVEQAMVDFDREWKTNQVEAVVTPDTTQIKNPDTSKGRKKQK